MSSLGALPALDVAKMPDPLDSAGKLMGLQGMMQQQQLGKIQIAQAQKAQQDQAALGQLMIKHAGNLDKVIADAPSSGVQPKTIIDLQQHNLEVKKNTLAYVSQMGAEAGRQADLMAGAHDAVTKAPPEQKAAVYQGQLQALKQQGIDTSQMPPDYPGDDQFKFLGAVVQGHKQQVEDALKQSDMAKNTAQAGKDNAQAGLAATEQRQKDLQSAASMLGGATSSLDYGQKLGGLAPGIASQFPHPGDWTPESKDAILNVGMTPHEQASVPVDRTEMKDWLQKNPGKGPADFMTYKASLVPKLNFNLGMQAANSMSDPALDNAAEKYWTSGVLPAGGRGPAVMAQNQKIMNRAAELHSGESIVEGSAAWKANQASLVGLQKNLDAVSAFENTAKKNLDLLVTVGKKVVDSGSPWINSPLRSIGQQGLGSEELSALNAARQVAVNEVAKVTSSPGLAGQLSDTARKEVEAFLPQSATLKQTVRVAEILTQDMANRHQSYQQQIDDIHTRLKGGKASSDSSTPQVTHKYNPATGKIEAVSQ